MQPIACWHIRCEGRLQNNLKYGICDLYPQPRAGKWYKRMRLYVGARVQFCAIHLEGSPYKGMIVAEGTIASEPLLSNNRLDPDFPAFVKRKSIDWLDHPQPCPCYRANPRRGSHRIGGKGPCS